MLGAGRFLLGAAICFAAGASGAEVAMRTVTVYDGHVTLDIPAAWNEIPPDVLEFYSLRSADASGGLVSETYQHGFRQGDPEADFAPPQILIQIRESGRISTRELRHLPPLQSLQERNEALVERSGPFLEGLRARAVAYDASTRSLRVSNALELRFEGTVIVDSASYLTERGTFTVHCYALRDRYLRMSPVFESVLASVRIDETLRYRPRLSDRLPRPAALAAYAVAAALAVAILVLHLVQRRRRPT